MNLFAALALALAGALPLAAAAQDPSSRPIQFVVPYTPATTADVLARLLGAKISQRWNVPVVVENKAGASGVIGTDAVAKAAPDGHTFLFVATSYGTIPALTPKLPYDPVKSFTPVALLGTSAMTLVVGNKVPAANIREFVALAKKQPGAVNYASPGNGSSQHLAMELFKQESGTQMLHVPYKGSAGALNDLVAGHVQASVVSLQTAGSFVQAGKLRMLGVMSRERVPAYPDVPTLAESGFPDLLVETWYGVLAPAGTPPAIVAKMNAEINQLLAQPDVKEAMAKQGVDPAGGAPERLGTLLRKELKLWSQVVTRGKIVAE
ncbi:MAG: Tripartite-type tricarboxylate transporter, receptor component TctC [Ramlibacter sp.]|jgi:tripartite-type tricarboxylate transporter receptor subunit TctC|nr:Tripartite-type tricarboxylate transporter, receptor component TctC [Ramlibacter sp.]MDB5913195.1 Tripartite-type tricarboxylate transporter, receptor component TctC [Ramlibacter sp.]